jgi:hypothetical protein
MAWLRLFYELGTDEVEFRACMGFVIWQRGGQMDRAEGERA